MRVLDRVVVVNPATGCHEWQGSLTNGYGRIQMDNQFYRAHRKVYEDANGPLPKDIDVRHTCDNRKCVGLSHLVPGTRLENMQDAVERDRMQKGEDRPLSKLTEETVRLIRRSPLSCRKIAKVLGVSNQLISNIKKRKCWKHVTDH